jgi:hypothetical protein
MNGMSHTLSPFFNGDMKKYTDMFEDPIKFYALAIPVFAYN